MKEIRTIIGDWMDESGVASRNETIAFHIHDGALYLMTKYPGWFIGKYGFLVDKYRRLMKLNGFDLTIHFIDLSCGRIREF